MKLAFTSGLRRLGLGSFGRAGLSLVALGLCSCVSETPSGSSSSNFLDCKRDPDCADYGVGATCSKESICVDRRGEPIPADAKPSADRDAGDASSEPGTSTADVVEAGMSEHESAPSSSSDTLSERTVQEGTGSSDAVPDDSVAPDDSTATETLPTELIEAGGPGAVGCYPFEPWTLTTFTPPTEGFVFSAPDGELFVMTQIGATWVVWLRDDDRLVARRTITAPDDNVSVTLDAPGTPAFRLRFEPSVNTSGAVLTVGEEETHLERVEVDVLEGLDVVAPQIPAQIWARAGVSGDRPYDIEEGEQDERLRGQVVIVGPEWGGGDDALRLFYGTEFPLVERPIKSIERLGGPDGDLIVTFRIAGGQATFDSDAVLATYDQADNDSVTIEGVGPSLPRRSTTERALAELSFSCDTAIDGPFQPSTVAPAALPAEVCGAGADIYAGLQDYDVAIYPQAENEDGSNETDLDFTATVTEIGESLPDDSNVDCSLVPDDLCARNFIRFDRDGADFWLFIAAPEYAAPVSVGDVVELKGRWSEVSFGGPYWDIALYTDAGLRTWLKRGWLSPTEPADLDGLELRAGDEVCVRGTLECRYDASQFSLSAALPGTPAVQIPIGSSQLIGDYSVANFAFELALGGDVPGCFDGPDSNVQIVVLPR